MSVSKESLWLASIPDGFHPLFLYPDGSEENKVPRVGELLWYSPSNNTMRAKPEHQKMYAASQLKGDLIFGVERVMPKLPLIAHGEAWHTGWDISTKWAIDANKVCWKDGAHGGSMHVVSKEELIGEFEDERAQNSIRQHLELPLKEPSWMAAARAAGWTPPKVP